MFGSTPMPSSPSVPPLLKMMRLVGLLFRSILLISALNRSSWERSARNTLQTAAKRSLSSSTAAGLWSAGTAIGRTM